MPDTGEQRPPTEGDTGQHPGPTAGNSRRLTYAQIAARLGISGDAARILVRRRGWRRIMPNRKGGVATIVVPEGALDDEDWRHDGEIPPDAVATALDDPATAPDSGLMAGALTALETAVLSLTARAESAEQRAQQAEQGREAERQRAEVTITGERHRAETANERAVVAQALADRAMAQLTDAVARADRAEAAITGERTRADVLRDRLEAAEQAAREATQAAQIALGAANSLHRDNEARRAKSLLARLLAGWRGE